MSTFFSKSTANFRDPPRTIFTTPSHGLTSSLKIVTSISSIQASKSKKGDFRHFSGAKVCYSKGQKCVIQMEMLDSRIARTCNGARRGSQKVLWVTKEG